MNTYLMTTDYWQLATFRQNCTESVTKASCLRLVQFGKERSGHVVHLQES